MSKKKSHILLFIQRYQAGGAERQASYLGKYLLEKGFRISVIAFGGNKNESFNWFEGLERYYLGFTEKNIFNEKPSLFIQIKKFRDLKRLIEQIKKINPDIIIPFTYQPNILVGKYWKKFGVKVGIWNQRDEGRYFKNSKSEFRALNSCKIHISNSKQGKEFLENLGVRKVELIHNGVNIPTYPKVKKEAGIIRFVMLANLHIFKDHLTLLKAWVLLNNNNSSAQNIELLCAGAFGNSEGLVNDFISEHNLNDSVRLLGKVDDTNSLLNSCDISVFSSIHEGLPNAVLESMAVGLPIIATRILGTEEALGEDYPYLAEPKNERQLAQMMQELILNENKRMEIGKSNLQRVESQFSISKMGDSFIYLFTNI